PGEIHAEHFRTGEVEPTTSLPAHGSSNTWFTSWTSWQTRDIGGAFCVPGFPRQPRSDAREELAFLRQDVRYHLTGDVGQTEVTTIEAIGEPLVIEAEQMQQRGMQVVDVDFVRHRLVAKLVGRSVMKAPFHSGPRQPDREAVGI